MGLGGFVKPCKNGGGLLRIGLDFGSLDTDQPHPRSEWQLTYHVDVDRGLGVEIRH